MSMACEAWPTAGWVVHPVTAAPAIRVVRAMPALPASVEAEIDALWAAAQRRTGGALFNGRVFSADTIAPSRIAGHWTEFRRIVAQMDRPALFATLGLRPMAVNGVVLGPDGVVLGRRPPHAVYQAGLWQCPPAGSIDAGAAVPDGSVDFAAQVLREADEELGLAPAALAMGEALALVEHAGSHVCDLGIVLRTHLSAAALQARHAAAGNEEYAALHVVPPAALAGFVATAEGGLVPQARVFLARLGLLAGPAADGVATIGG